MEPVEQVSRGKVVISTQHIDFFSPKRGQWDRERLGKHFSILQETANKQITFPESLCYIESDSPIETEKYVKTVWANLLIQR